MSVLADWLVAHARDRLERDDLSVPQRRALLALQRCRTPAAGGHRYRCAECGGEHFGFHSCHHRACPRCGGANTAAWTQKQTARLLPVPYFLVTCTVPEALRAVALARPAWFFDAFFRHAAAALQSIADQRRHLGAQLGMLGVLHTWGRQLQLHPHLHFIVPGGGLRADGKKWRKTRRPDWFLPGDAVAAELRRAMDDALRAEAPELHAALPESTWREGWWVHVQPAGSGANVVKYLARYVGRTAISDERIVEAREDAVRFRYTDTRDGVRKECELEADEFMRRYLLHVLPPGLHRVRYFGWMHPAATRRRAIVETLLEAVIVVRPKEDPPPPWHLRCPHCERFALVLVGTLPRGPPPRGPS